jgi:3-oxoacyl-[acyl-carrier protein] reductase
VALDLAPRGNVNNIQSGPTETDMTLTMISQIVEVIPLKRVAQLDEIAGLACYLARPETGYITGASLTQTAALCSKPGVGTESH